MNVFIHGTFGSLMTLLSIPNVLKGDIQDTLYRNVNRKMRKDPFFFRDQPILDRGLSRITPSFELEASGNKKFAAYPILQAFDTLDAAVGNKAINHYYTFGWTGLMSQYRRRKEAIRLYNALTEELIELKKQGITPKVRIIAHSHGGNVCLNLAAINHILKTDALSSYIRKNPNSNKQASIKQMFDLLNHLPQKENIHLNNDQKKYDYLPTVKNLTIDELILFGTPVQPETECFCQSKTFKKIYNFYSDEDKVQDLDGVSTKRSYSLKKFLSNLIHRTHKHNKIVQARIMYDRQEVNKENKNKDKVPEASIWTKLLSLGKLFKKNYKDPNHKELWFVDWKQENKEQAHSLSPLPTVILTPLLVKLLNTKSSCNDVDLNITHDDDNLHVELYKHNSIKQENHTDFPLTTINMIKEKFKPWKPENTSERSGFDALYRHLL